MKTQKSQMTQKPIKTIIEVLLLILLTSCVSTVKFAYNVQKPPVAREKIITNSTILFSIIDLRAEPDIVGYVYNRYGMKSKTFKTGDFNLSNSIYKQMKDELAKNGFVFIEDEKNSDLKLTFSIMRLFGEMRDKMFTMPVDASCCIRISLKSSAENIEFFKSEVCGKSEKNGSMINWQKSVLEGLSLAIDNSLNKILNETDLISQINNFK